MRGAGGSPLVLDDILQAVTLELMEGRDMLRSLVELVALSP